MSRKPRKMVETSKDMFMIYMTFAFLMGWFLSDIYVALTLAYD